MKVKVEAQEELEHSNGKGKVEVKEKIFKNCPKVKVEGRKELEFFLSQGHCRRCCGLVLCKFHRNMQRRK